MVTRESPFEDKTVPVLPCPECRTRGYEGQGRIGNRRRTCATCNNFARNVSRRASAMLKEAHKTEYLKLQLRVELDLYPQVIEEFDSRRVSKVREP